MTVTTTHTDLHDAQFIQIAEQARHDGDLPRYLGAMASINPDTVNRLAAALRSPIGDLFADPCANCDGFGQAMTSSGLIICPDCQGTGS